MEEKPSRETCLSVVRVRKTFFLGGGGGGDGPSKKEQSTTLLQMFEV